MGGLWLLTVSPMRSSVLNVRGNRCVVRIRSSAGGLDRQFNERDWEKLQFALKIVRTLAPLAGTMRSLGTDFRRVRGHSSADRSLAAKQSLLYRRRNMSIAKISEISATSTKSFEDAIQQGIARATKTLRNVKSAWIKEQHIRIENGLPSEYQVNMMVTFVLDE